jgi:hypothetical protein
VRIEVFIEVDHEAKSSYRCLLKFGESVASIFTVKLVFFLVGSSEILVTMYKIMCCLNEEHYSLYADLIIGKSCIFASCL